MNKGKVKEFVKKHKAKLLVAAGGAAIIGTVAYGLSKHNRTTYTDLDHPTLEQGNLLRVSRAENGKYAGLHLAAMEHVPITHLGKVGEKLCEVDGIEQDALCTILLGCEK